MTFHRKLLVVDDETAILEVIQETFRDTGIEVLTSTNPIHALHVFKTQFPQVVLADLDLRTAMDGVTMATRMKIEAPLTIVVVLSGMLSLFQVAYLRGAGIDTALAKPVDLATLRECVDIAFKLREGWEKLP